MWGGGGKGLGRWGARVGRVRVDVNEELKFLGKLKKTKIDVYETLCPQQMLVHKGGKIKNWGGECRDVTPTKLQSQNIFKESTGGSGWGRGQDGCGRRIKFCENSKNNLLFIFFFFRGGGWSSGIRVDVNEELN